MLFVGTVIFVGVEHLLCDFFGGGGGILPFLFFPPFFLSCAYTSFGPKTSAIDRGRTAIYTVSFANTPSARHKRFMPLTFQGHKFTGSQGSNVKCQKVTLWRICLGGSRKDCKETQHPPMKHNTDCKRGRCCIARFAEVHSPESQICKFCWAMLATLCIRDFRN